MRDNNYYEFTYDNARVSKINPTFLERLTCRLAGGEYKKVSFDEWLLKGIVEDSTKGFK
jgi:hypothetical protein